MLHGLCLSSWNASLIQPHLTSEALLTAILPNHSKVVAEKQERNTSKARRAPARARKNQKSGGGGEEEKEEKEEEKTKADSPFSKPKMTLGTPSSGEDIPPKAVKPFESRADNRADKLL